MAGGWGQFLAVLEQAVNLLFFLMFAASACVFLAACAIGLIRWVRRRRREARAAAETEHEEGAPPFGSPTWLCRCREEEGQ